MRNNIIFSIFVLLFTLIGCQKEEMFKLPLVQNGGDNPNLTLETSSGFKSFVGEIYVQKDLATGLKVSSPNGEVISATWTIQGMSYSQIQIWHKFTVLGQVNITVTAVLANGTTETGNFVATSVIDITEGDPVKFFVSPGSNGSWNVIFLINKERVRQASDTNFFYTGTISDWEQIIIPPQDKRYIISNNLPEPTSDVGKFLATKHNLNTQDNGEYNMAIIHSGNNWADLSGSAFTRITNNGLLYFSFINGVITPLGDGYQGNYPGTAGDNFVRTEQGSTSLTIYMKLDANFTSSAFATLQLDGGGYGSPILMSAVADYPEWGKIIIPLSEVQGKLLGMRYGPNASQPTVYSNNMSSSFFYDLFFKNLRLSVANLE